MEQEKKEWCSIACFISKGATLEVKKISCEESQFESCTFPVTLCKKTFNGDKYVNVTVQTTNPKDIDKILNKELKEYSNIHVRGYWDSFEKNGKVYWTLKTGKDPITYISSPESLKKENLKTNTKKVIYGGVSSIKFFHNDKEQRSGLLNLIAEGTDKDGNRQSINVKVTNPELTTIMQENVKIGTSLIIEGTVKEDSFKDKNGDLKTAKFLDCDKFVYASRPDFIANKLFPKEKADDKQDENTLNIEK